MSANQRKVVVLKSLLERVQQRAAMPRRSASMAATAAAAMVASAPAEAVVSIEEPDLTPLVTEAVSAMEAPEIASLQAAEELTPSEEIVVIDISSLPPPAKEDELEVVIDDELASEAALIEEALTASDEDDAEAEPPISSRRPAGMHSLEAAMEPMTLDPISDRPTARITLPPESGPQISVGELAPAPMPSFDEPAELEEVSELEPEITISSEPADVIWSEEGPAIEQVGGLVELSPVEALELELSPPPSPAKPDGSPEKAAEVEADAVVEAVQEPAVVPLSLDDVVMVPSAPPASPAGQDGADVRVLAEPPPLPIAEPPAAAVANPLPIEIEADVVRRPLSAKVEVAKFVGEAERFAPKTFGELLDASLEL